MVLGKAYDIYAFPETWLSGSHSISALPGDMSHECDVVCSDRSKRSGGGVLLLVQ